MYGYTYVHIPISSAKLCHIVAGFLLAYLDCVIRSRLVALLTFSTLTSFPYLTKH